TSTTHAFFKGLWRDCHAKDSCVLSKSLPTDRRRPEPTTDPVRAKSEGGSSLVPIEMDVSQEFSVAAAPRQVTSLLDGGVLDVFGPIARALPHGLLELLRLRRFGIPRRVGALSAMTAK